MARVQHHLAGLQGPHGNEHLWTLIKFAAGGEPMADMFAFRIDRGVTDSTSSFGGPPEARQDAHELAAHLTEVDQDTARAVLVGMTLRTLAYGVRGPLSGRQGPGRRRKAHRAAGTWDPVVDEH